MNFFEILILLSLLPRPVEAGEVLCTSTGYAEIAFQNKQDQKAVACLDYLIEKQPDNGDARFLKGKYCLKIRDWDCVSKMFTARSARAAHREKILDLLFQSFNYYLNVEDSKTAAKLYRMIPGFNQKDACASFYKQGNQAKPEECYKFYKLSKEFCGKVNDQEIGKKFMLIAQRQPIYQRKQWLDRAAYFISWDEIHSVFPPLKENIVFENTCEGRGLHNAVKALESGKDAIYGDTVSLEGSRFRVAVGDKWVEASGWFKITKFSLPEGQALNISAEKGVRVNIKVIRITRSY
jgi:tetratricopeptide (TPR) repeat protein